MAALFRKLQPAAARLHTLFHRHARGLAFTAAGQTWRFRPTPGGPAHGATVYGTLGDAEFTVWLDDPDWKTAAAAVLEVPPDALESLPEQLVRAALEAFADGALTALEKATGLPVAVSRLERAASAPLSSACPFELLADGGQRIGGAWVAAEADGGGRLAAALAALPVLEAALPDDFPLVATVALGVWTAPAAVVEDLSPGDVALSPAGAERFVTIGSKLRCAARLADGVLSLEGKTMTDATPAPAPGSETLPGEAMVPVDGIEVELQAQVGRLTLTLAQLKQLGAGQVVEFSTPTESPATLLANGRPVATGELVDVGGRVGVRITAMAEQG